MKAIDIIEFARSYYLYSNDKSGSKPIFIGGRIKLELALEGINNNMIIATSGNNKKCIVLMDYTTDELLLLAHKANNKVLTLKSN